MERRSMLGSMSCSAAVQALRFAYGIVFLLNVSCAIGFIVFPDRFAGAYELSGVAGRTATQGIGIAFLMWNATYPPVIVNPQRFSALAVVVLVQQVIGLAGESMIYVALPADHDVLAGGITRFMAFDGAGLALMSAAYIVFVLTAASQAKRQDNPPSKE